MVFLYAKVLYNSFLFIINQQRDTKSSLRFIHFFTFYVMKVLEIMNQYFKNYCFSWLELFIVILGEKIASVRRPSILKGANHLKIRFDSWTDLLFLEWPKRGSTLDGIFVFKTFF
jgi:hypothetical protein